MGGGSIKNETIKRFIEFILKIIKKKNTKLSIIKTKK